MFCFVSFKEFTFTVSYLTNVGKISTDCTSTRLTGLFVSQSIYFLSNFSHLTQQSKNFLYERNNWQSNSRNLSLPNVPHGQFVEIFRLQKREISLALVVLAFCDLATAIIVSFWLNPVWHNISKQERCSAPPKGNFYKTQWPGQSIKITHLM